MHDCKAHKMCARMFKNHGTVKLTDIYRVYVEKKNGQRIWIVRGDMVSRMLYPEWIMGGNDQRYRFNPSNEIWIDDRIGADEFPLTLTHELLERKLMCERGFSYDRAHAEALALEKTLRIKNAKMARRQGNKLLSMIADRTFDNPLDPVDLGKIANLYRTYIGKSRGASIWIVDGPLVRAELNADFCFGDNGFMQNFIPNNEIWLDSAMSTLEMYFTLFRQKLEYKLLASGSSKERAYELSLIAQLDERERQARLAKTHEDRLCPVRYGRRSRGVKSCG